MKQVTDKTEFIIGIDFGHGETSATFRSLKNNDCHDLEILPGIKAIKSAVAILKQEGKETICVGDSAIDYAPYAEDFQISFKKRPSEMDATERYHMIAFMHGVYAEILDKNPDFTMRDHAVFIARPSQDRLWKGEENTYLAMAEEAGLPIAGIQKESRAAYFRARTQSDSKIDMQVKKGILIVDFGSSTVDFTYLNSTLTGPIDDGCNLGASEVEELLMTYAMSHLSSPSMQEFANKYGDAKDSNAYNQLLFTFREAKEDFYGKKRPFFQALFNYNLLTCSDGSPISGCDTFLIPREEVNTILGKGIKNGYIERVREAVTKFKCEKLNDNPVSCVYLTGGASRMDFVREIFMEVFGLDSAHCPSDNDPSLIVSQGVANLSYADIKTVQTGIELKKKADQIIDTYNWDRLFKDAIGNEVSAAIQREALNIMKDWSNVSSSIYQLIYIDDYIDRARYRTTESGLVHVHNLYSLKKRFEEVFNSFLYRDFAKGCEERINSIVLDNIINEVKKALIAYQYKPSSKQLSITSISTRIKQSGVKKLSSKFISEGRGHVIYDAVSDTYTMVDWNSEKNRTPIARTNHLNHFLRHNASIFSSYEWENFINNDLEFAGISEAKAATRDFAKDLVDEYISYAKLAIFFN